MAGAPPRPWLALAVLLLAGCLAPVDPAAPPAPDARAVGVWSADECVGFSAVWTPALERLQEVVGPRWTPAPGPLPGRGVFVLFAVAPGCASAVDGVATEDATLAAAIVRVEPPADDRGHDAERWAVVPEAVGDRAAPHVRLFEEAGFAVAPGEATVELRPAAAGVAVRMRVATADGTVEVDGVVGGASSDVAVEAALASAGEGPLGVFAGPESYARQEAGAAIVRASGDTWVSRLALEPRPFAVALDSEFDWDFTFSRHEA